MSGNIIPDDNVAAPQLRDEKMFDVSFEGVAVQRTLNHHGSLDAAQCNRPDDGEIRRSFFKWFADHGALSARRTSLRPSHLEMDAKLIQKPDAVRWECGLECLKGSAFHRLGFGGAARFF